MTPDRLRRVQVALRHNLPFQPEDRQLLADALDAVLAGEDPKVAFGLEVAPGRRTYATTSALRTRNRMLRDAAERFYPGQPAAAQARELASALHRYRSTAWPHDRRYLADGCPTRHHGTVRETGWLLLSAGYTIPSAERLRKILLVTSYPYS